MVNSYVKPMVTRIELRPAEALLQPCKTEVNDYSAYCSGLNGCEVGFECRNELGS